MVQLISKVVTDKSSLTSSYCCSWSVGKIIKANWRFSKYDYTDISLLTEHGIKVMYIKTESSLRSEDKQEPLESL